jgi:hypothetical protein
VASEATAEPNDKRRARDASFRDLPEARPKQKRSPERLRDAGKALFEHPGRPNSQTGPAAGRLIRHAAGYGFVTAPVETATGRHRYGG